MGNYRKPVANDIPNVESLDTPLQECLPSSLLLNIILEVLSVEIRKGGNRMRTYWKARSKIVSIQDDNIQCRNSKDSTKKLLNY